MIAVKIIMAIWAVEIIVFIAALCFSPYWEE